MTRSIQSSRLSGFYRAALPERVALIGRSAPMGDETRAHFARGGGLSLEVADRMSENVIAVHGLPLSVALNFVINGRDLLVPMAVEEPSVVAAASNAARMVRASGGFVGEAAPPMMIAQVQFDDVPDAAEAPARVEAGRGELLAAGNAAVASVVARGGGCRDIDVRVLDAALGVVVVHVHVDVVDAMGANIVDSVAEALAAPLHEVLGGRVGLRILSNLPIRRLVSVRADIGAEIMGGDGVADAVVRASRFADLDPYRAVTHNKGFMNGVDAAAVALGQDWRSIEAAAHAYAAVDGVYRPISRWRRTEGGVRGEATFPLAVGTVGGSTRAHPGVRAAFDLLRVRDARELAVVLAAAGLASNFAALRALASEGIQRGHMRLHRRKSEAAPRATDAPPTSCPPHVNGSVVVAPMGGAPRSARPGALGLEMEKS